MGKFKRVTSVFMCLLTFFSMFDMGVSAEEIQQEYKDLTFSVEYKDNHNSDGRRDITSFVRVLKNGNEINSNIEELEDHNDVITYSVKDVPVYSDDLQSTNTYALSLSNLKGYVANKSLFTFNNNYTLDENVQLSLESYSVSGTVSFDEIPEMSAEDYFNTVFENVDVDYEEVDSKNYTFTLNNLWKNDKNGNDKTYWFDDQIEGYDVNQEVEIREDSTINLIYTKQVEEDEDNNSEVSIMPATTNEDTNEGTDTSEDTHTVEYEGTQSFSLNWFDDKIDSRDNYGTITLTVGTTKLNYTFNGNSWTTSDTSSVFNVNEITFKKTSNSAQLQEVSVSKIPSKIDDESVESSISYSYSGDDYTVEKEENTNNYSIYHLTTYIMNIVVSDGGVDINDWIKESLSLTSDNTDLNSKLSNKTYTLTQESNENGKVTYTLSVSGLKEYTTSDGAKVPVTYDAQVSNVSTDGKITYTDNDQFEVTYDNTSVANYGADTSSVKNTGSLKLLLTGTTKYTATKVWLGSAENKPNTTWYLWRYSKKSGVNYTQAAQVSENGSVVKWENVNTTSSLTWTKENLPKYDTDGYEYVHLAREVMGKSNYVKHYGTVKNSFNDDKNADGEAQSESVRNGDTSIYK